MVQGSVVHGSVIHGWKKDCSMFKVKKRLKVFRLKAEGKTPFVKTILDPRQDHSGMTFVVHSGMT